MGIPKQESARYSSLQEFIGFSKTNDNAPSFTNLFSVHFSTPPMIAEQTAGNRFRPEVGDMSLLLDYYAKNVNLPSKQITTGQVTTVGAGYKIATGTAFSQISMTFTMPRSQQTRNFFERWTSLMVNDANQYTDYYDTYCAPEVIIYKWERGGGDYAYSDPRSIRALRDSGDDFLLAKKNKLTAAWVLKKVFPYNIGSVQLDNSQAKTMDLSVQFYYERYRFFTEDQFDAPGVRNIITIPSGSDNVTTQETSRNTQVEQINRSTPVINGGASILSAFNSDVG